MIRFPCPHCGKQLSAPAGCDGKDTKCPGCAQPLQVPRQGKLVPATPARDKTVLGELLSHEPTMPPTRGRTGPTAPAGRLPQQKTGARWRIAVLLAAALMLGVAVYLVATRLLPSSATPASSPSVRGTQPQTDLEKGVAAR